MKAQVIPSISIPDKGLNEYIRDGLIEACKEALRPLIKLCIKHGISYPELSSALKYVFVESADEDHLGTDRASPSRMAILTGIPSREIREIHGIEPESKTSAARMAAAGQVLSAWHADPEFTGPYGMPLELEFEGPGSFTDLVEQYGDEFDRDEILQELMRVGCAAPSKSGTVNVLRRSYISAEVDPVSLTYIGKSLRSLAETLEFNLGRQDIKDRRFERQFFSTSGIRASDLGAFLELLQEAGQKFLEDLDSWTTEREKALKKLEKIPNEIPRVFPGVGMFLFFNLKPIKRVKPR